MSRSSLPVFEPLKNNLKVKVGIVGGGITGLTIAYELSRRGISAVILEDGAIAGGESSRTSAHLSNALDDRYYNLEQVHGKENARLAAESHSAAIDYIESLCKEKNIDCDFERVEAYLFNPPLQESDNLIKELNAAKRCGIDVTMVDKSPIESYNTGPCVKFPSQAEFSPLKYLEKLSHCVVEMGGKIFDQTHVKEIRETKDGCQLITVSGNIVEAENVVIATNSPINNPFFPHLKQASYRTYIIAGSIPKGSVPKALYYDTLDPYHYIRVVEESDSDTDLLLVGGEDHRVGICADPNESYEILERWTKTRFPKMGPITHRWSGQIVEPIDSLAFIGRSKSHSKIFIATGDSGNGLTHGTIAGMLISDLITGKSNPWEKLYDPSRKSLSALSDFVEENAVTFAQYRDWVTEGDVSSINEIKPNSGAIVRQGAQKIAAYKDSDGQIHTLSAVCPHLKGLVRWNEAEQTWDCPCHGSRFKATGEVINGPANCPLARYEKG
ncbi:MAG: FAD-dependent oxidoreductase [Parachlamydiaceae bacterium]|nr:FAD-dependent oxidoreductase [Parachlamydiaceae bacterium]